MESNNQGLVAIAVAILIASLFLGELLSRGITRAGAMKSGMTADQYSEWMDRIDSLN